MTCTTSTLNDGDPFGADDQRPRFDRREMVVVHDVFRREFGLMPELIGTVAPGDCDRAHLVGDHIDRLTSLLHHHHRGEDAYVWPLLVNRCTDSAAALTESMHDQHEHLAAHLEAVDARLGVWRVDAAADAGNRLFEALDRTLTSLRQHLDDEERFVVPLMEQHISAAEWDAIVQQGSADADPADLPLLFGMLMYEGDPEIIERALAAMPVDAQPVVRSLAAEAFAEHSQAIHGTPTPQRGAERRECRHA